MDKELELERKTLEEAYRSRMNAILEKHASKGQVFQEIQALAKSKARMKQSAHLESIARNLSADVVRGWMGKDAKLPGQPFILETLIEFVEATKVSDSSDFRSLAYALKASRLKTHPALKGNYERATKLADAGHLAFKPLSSATLNLENIALGSWLLDGRVPPYVSRDQDSRVLEKFDSDNAGLLCLVGPPKAGKTRSLVENIRSSSLRDAPIYWLTPTAESIDAFLRDIRPSDEPNAVIVLDDLQRFQPPHLLTSERLLALKSRGFVAVTLHDSTLDSWSQQRIDHSGATSLGPQKDVLDQLASTAIHYPSSLTAAETENAKEKLNLISDDQSDYEHLPSWAASVDQLTAVAKTMTHRPIEAATLQAIFDARIFFPGGASIVDIERLAKRRLESLSPNSIWLTAGWEQALEKVTTGIVQGSAHAILMKNLAQPDNYLLLDALWGPLLPHDWTPVALDELGYSLPQAARAADQAGLRMAAIGILKDEIDQLSARDLCFLGDLLQFEFLFKDARPVYDRAIEMGDISALNNLGNLESVSGDLQKGIDLYEIVINNHLDSDTAPVAMNNLARALMHKNRITYSSSPTEYASAESLWKESARRGNEEYLHNNLGYLALLRRDFVEAERLFALAMENGDPVGFINMGVFQMRKGDLDEAVSCFRGVSDEMYKSLYQGVRVRGHRAIAVLRELMGEGESHAEEILWHFDRALSIETGFATHLTQASYKRRYQNASEAQELYASIGKYDHYLDYEWLVDLETMGWWDEYDKAFIRRNVGEEIKPLW